MRWTWLPVGVVALVVAACSSSTKPAATTSAVSGKLTLSSYPAAPTGVAAIDETGARTHVVIGADGSFKLDLLKGHLYKLVVLTPGGEEPIVFPRDANRFDKNFRVSSAAALVALGGVHHYDRAPQAGFTVMKRTSTTTKDNNAEGNEGECVDGHLQGTNTPCVDEDDQTICEDGADASDGDGECEHGTDAKTGQPCTDSDHAGEEEDADPTQPMSVPEKNAPNDISGCAEGSDGEEEDD